MTEGIVFGPVPSRRLGHSLGVNNIPPKRCSYSCAYCQLGVTHGLQIERQEFYCPDEICAAVEVRVERARQQGTPVDYITLVADGEPTLDANLGREIALLQSTGIPVAVITNASLLWRADVRDDLARADWVSLKVDATRDEVWRRIDRPHPALRLPAILESLLEWSADYEGTLVTETMLVHGVNDGDACVREVASFLSRLKPDRVWLAIPTRPPALLWAHAPDEERVVQAHLLMSEQVSHVEFLVGYEGNAFAPAGDPETELQDITAVHPMREEAVRAFLAASGGDWHVVDDLVARGVIAVVDHAGHRYYVRRLGGGRAAGRH